MTLSSFLLILIGVLLNAGAQLLLKAGTRVIGVISTDRGNVLHLVTTIGTEPHILAGLAFYVFSVGIWIVALSRVDVMIAYPMLSIGYVVNALIAWQLFGEPLTATRMVGIGIIILGVVVISRG
jgi:multidrug transporter EmrE-like cation transporter